MYKNNKEVVKNQQNIDYVKERYTECNNITKAVMMLCDEIGCEYNDSLRRVFSKILERNKVTDNRELILLEDTDIYQKAVNSKLKPSKYYLISWAQAETKVHKQFWKNMQAYAEYIGAEIIIQPGRYGSPTSLKKNRKKYELTWDSKIIDYLYADRLNLNDKVTVLADLKIQPTAVIPINGINGFTAEKTSIIPHPKVQLRSLPVLDAYDSKLVLTTGAVTIPNYTDSKAGARGKFEHELGFAIVEIVDNEKYYVRQVQAANDGTFQDLKYLVENGKVIVNKHLPFITMGDIHYGEHDEEAYNTALSLLDEYQVENVALHDFFSGYTVNHHELKNPFTIMDKEYREQLDLTYEINQCLDELHNLNNSYKDTRFLLVASNHNDFLDRWLMNTDWRKSRNMRAYLDLANIKASNPNGSIFNSLVEKYCNSIYSPKGCGTTVTKQILTLEYGGSYRVNDYELALHYDRGANGSRGSLNQFKDLSTKSVGGHGHAPQRIGGAVMAGTLTKKRMGYNTGLSSWMHGVVIGYDTGKVSHIHIIDGKYTTL